MQLGAVRWRACALAVVLLVHAVMTSPLLTRPRRRVTRQAGDVYLEPQTEQVYYEQGPMLSEDVFGQVVPRGPRDKRTIKLLLNVLFWKINTLLEFKTRLLAEISERQRLGGRRPPTTPKPVDPEEDDVPEFDSNRVMLDIPGELFGTAFSVVTDVSKIVGDVILNTARRTQRFIEALKPALARTLGYKITALTGASSISTNTADKPVQSEDTDSSNDSQNDV